MSRIFLIICTYVLMTSTMAIGAETHMLFERIGFNNEEYMDLLEKMIAQVEHLQNNPDNKLIPRERLIADVVKNYLQNLAGISIKTHSYDSEGNRPNLIIRYKHPQVETQGTISFMGSHMDVVPADSTEWVHDPFHLTREAIGNDYKLHGRGTTDCLGHVALLSLMMKHLAQEQVMLNREVVVVFIADEEHGGANVGVFELHKEGLLQDLKRGPIYWVDTATDDGLFGPRVGTGGNGRWNITVTGKSGHSGYPQLCINPISIAMDLMNFINERFVKDFQNEKAAIYAKAHLYPSCSNCKCTQIHSIAPSKNTIPGQCTFGGDVRFTPDFDAERIKMALPTYVREFSAKLSNDDYQLSTAGSGKSFTFDEHKNKIDARIEFAWDNENFNKPFAADINSQAYKNILQAMKEVRGQVQPFSALGSLPLLYELSAEGYSLVPLGFGRQKAYHAPNEYCVLSEMRDGYEVMVRAIELFEH